MTPPRHPIAHGFVVAPSITVALTARAVWQTQELQELQAVQAVQELQEVQEVQEEPGVVVIVAIALLIQHCPTEYLQEC